MASRARMKDNFKGSNQESKDKKQKIKQRRKKP